MCGIAGIIGGSDAGIREAVARMNEAQLHRGPDAGAIWPDPVTAAPLVVGHRRLSIIDLSPDGNQPMVDAANGNVIVFNGEIYNFQELRDELQKGGASFRTHGDTEVILKAYAAWGEGCVERFRGMFVFVLWDAQKRRVLLARDRLGIKPLYYAPMTRPDGRRFILFASEVRALLASGMIERRLDPAGLATYLWNGFLVGPGTILRGVNLLPPGGTAMVDADTLAMTERRYWRVPNREEAGAGSVERLGEELARAMKLHLISDVPLGVFLSGGVDSSAMAALAVRVSNGHIRTFNLAFAEAEYDESRYARAVAEALGTEHVEVQLSEADFAAQMDDALASIDQPTFDAINTYFISRAVRGAGMTVALAGTGGDELFGGYSSFEDIPRAMAWGRRLAAVPEPMVRAAAAVVTRLKTGRPGRVPPQTRWGKLGDTLAARGKLLELYQLSHALFLPGFQRRLLNGVDHGQTYFGGAGGRIDELRDLIRGDSSLSAIAKLEISLFLGERLLRDTDAASMAASIEVRVPLLDHGVVQAACGMDDAARFLPARRKQALRDVGLVGLDPAIFDRPKSGFVLPIDAWCRRRLKDRISETLGDGELCRSVGLDPAPVAALWSAFQAGAPGIYWSRVWSLAVLLWWCRRHRVTLSPRVI